MSEAIIVALITGGLSLAGAHDDYNTGDKVKFNGKVYESTVDNNVYSPSTYPAGWKEVS